MSVGWTNSDRGAAQLGRDQEQRPQLPQGSGQPPPRLLPVFAPSELHLQQPQGQTAAYQCWPPAKAPWAPQRGGVRSGPPLLPSVLSHAWYRGLVTKHQLSLMCHHITLHPWCGDRRILGLCFGLLLAPAPVTGNWNSSWLQRVLGAQLIILHFSAVRCRTDCRSHDECPQGDQSNQETADGTSSGT